MPQRIEPHTLYELTGGGTPAGVAAEIRARFGPRVDHIWRCTPYAIDAACFGGRVDAFRYLGSRCPPPPRLT